MKIRIITVAMTPEINVVAKVSKVDKCNRVNEINWVMRSVELMKIN